MGACNVRVPVTAACALAALTTGPIAAQPERLAPRRDSTVLYDVSDRKQLFIDDRFIESSRGVTLTMNPPMKLGPLLLPDRPWESLRIGFCDAVMEYQGEYRLFYGSMARGKGTFVCLATSRDGL
ncbi:MAG: hypothetical protein ACE5O2_10865, partial [Armatimonadota bacterium]